MSFARLGGTIVLTCIAMHEGRQALVENQRIDVEELLEFDPD